MCPYGGCFSSAFCSTVLKHMVGEAKIAWVPISDPYLTSCLMLRKPPCSGFLDYKMGIIAYPYHIKSF